MAEVFIAAAPGEEAQARGLAEALTLMGFNAAAGVPGETDIAKLAEESKCVTPLWSRAAASSPWLTALAVLALDRKKLVSAEYDGGTAPSPFHGAPRIALAARDRAKFKASFEALAAELEKLTETKANAEKLPEALAQARAALLKPILPPVSPRWRTLGGFALGVLALFALGFGTGRVIQAFRSGEFLVATTAADAAPTEAAQTSALIATPASITLTDLERRPWRELAATIDEAAAERIKAQARDGDALAQTLACLGHLAGAEGFLPSPTAAREQCDAGAAQNNPAALYYSWVLQRAAPHAGIDEATARGRLEQAARMGWTPAQIDYALTLAPDPRAPLEAQAEAGRLWLAAAEANDPRGQFHYARWLRDSPAGPRDPAAAIPFLERAARGGQAEATHMLATFYRDGVGVARDSGRARALYEQAARAHHTPAMFNLADMLRGGSAEDRARAVALYSELACMRDERQIQPMAVQRLRALHESASCR